MLASVTCSIKSWIPHFRHNAETLSRALVLYGMTIHVRTVLLTLSNYVLRCWELSLESWSCRILQSHNILWGKSYRKTFTCGGEDRDTFLPPSSIKPFLFPKALRTVYNRQTIRTLHRKSGIWLFPKFTKLRSTPPLVARLPARRPAELKLTEFDQYHRVSAISGGKHYLQSPFTTR